MGHSSETTRNKASAKPGASEARRPRELKEPSPGTPARNLNDDPGDPRDTPVVFHAYQPTSDVGPKKNTNAADLSGGASEENVVLITGNWFCDFSVDGGLNYKRVSPPSFFATPLAGGFCCDQIMIFVPGLNRFVWLMQHDTDANGSGAFRLAMATPADIKNDFSTAWTFWDFIPDDFNLKGVWLDFPDVAYTDEFLHITIDAVERGGTLIVRISPKEMALGGTINFRFNGSVRLILPLANEQQG